MNIGPIVDVAIGLVFIWITAILDKRAKDMEASIHEMLANPNLKAQFYDHPIIRGLTAKKRSKLPKSQSCFIDIQFSVALPKKKENFRLTFPPNSLHLPCLILL